MAEVFLPFALDLPVSNSAALEFLEMNLPSLAMLIFPLDDLTLAGANFRALDKFDFETPKMVATLAIFSILAAPCVASAAWILLRTISLTSATVDPELIEEDVVAVEDIEPGFSALELIELVAVPIPVSMASIER